MVISTFFRTISFDTVVIHFLPATFENLKKTAFFPCVLLLWEQHVPVKERPRMTKCAICNVHLWSNHVEVFHNKSISKKTFGQSSEAWKC